MRLAVPGALPALQSGTPVVTSSRVLAGVAYQQFARIHLNAGARSWGRPDIFTFDAWLTSLWQAARYTSPALPTLLSPAQEHFLWQQIVSRHRPGLFDPATVARLAAQAADVVTQYQIPLDDAAWAEQQDAEQFHEWYADFRSRCQSEGWMARREILCQLKPVVQPFFIGFDQLPAPGKLLALEDKGRVARIGLKEATSFREELEIAARWARAKFEAAPHQSIAVFVPRLRAQTAPVARVFHSVFNPGRYLRIDAGSLASVFHINAPQPLLDHPLIASALLLLELARPHMAQADATSILRSQFISAAHEERSLRAKADLNLRRTRELDVTLRELEWASRECPRLQHLWSRVRTALNRRQQTTDFSRWARFFADLLHAAGWPGDRELGAEEQRIVEMWKDALSSLSGLGLVSAAVAFDTAVGQLKRLLAIGGPEVGDWLSPVQILDAADAPGLAFDAAFLTGLSDETWPTVEPVSPLIPARLQRASGVLAANPAGLRKAGLDATRALVHAAPAIAGAFHARLAPQVRACVVRVSKLDDEIWPGKSPLESFQSEELAEYRETHGPPFNTSSEARGGTRLIKAQSECPFKAFAANRLKAALPEEASFGFDALDRGKFVHKALELVWAELKTQGALKAASEEDLRTLVRSAVESALANQDGTAFYSQASQVERERLERLVWEWLTMVEMQRTIPFTVQSAEEAMHITLGGLQFSVRMDRIDRLPNGSLVLIDYKTGANINKNRLVGERPAEPQLLIYAAAQTQKVEGVLFGCVVPREWRYAGFTRSKLINSRTVEVAKDWREFISESHDAVEKLAAEFVRGEAVIRPSKSACGFCDLAALCRKEEQASMAEEDA